MNRFECVAVLCVLSGIAACGKEKGSSAAPDSSGVRPAVPEASAAPAPDTGKGRAVLFLGTSLTAGLGLDPDSAFSAQVQRLIDQRKLPFHTVNAGVSGETSAGLLQRLDWVLQQPAAVIVVETGANDGLRGQPVEGTKATIGKILERIHAAQPGARVILVQMEALPNFGSDYTHAFHAMFPALAREHGVTLMPFLLDSVAGFASLNQADGIHPNYVGERIVTRHVWRTLGPLLDSLTTGVASPRRGG